MAGRLAMQVLVRILVTAVFTAGCGLLGAEPPKLPPAASRAVDFVRDIQPILADRCNHCLEGDRGEEALGLYRAAIRPAARSPGRCVGAEPHRPVRTRAIGKRGPRTVPRG